MSSVIIAGNTSGTITLDAPNVAGTTTLTLPTTNGTILTSATTQAGLPTNIAGNGPAFSAYRSTNQSFSFTAWTKISLNAEDFDTNNNFDSTTNYRFTPTVAGYYQFNGVVAIQSTTSVSRTIVALWKNNAQALRGSDLPISAGTQVVFANVQGLFYMNGTTDYMELYVYAQGSGTLNIIANSGEYPTLSGFLARAA